MNSYDVMIVDIISVCGSHFYPESNCSSHLSTVFIEMNKEVFMRPLVTKCTTFVSCIYRLVNLLEKEQ